MRCRLRIFAFLRTSLSPTRGGSLVEGTLSEADDYVFGQIAYFCKEELLINRIKNRRVDLSNQESQTSYTMFRKISDHSDKSRRHNEHLQANLYNFN